MLRIFTLLSLALFSTAVFAAEPNKEVLTAMDNWKKAMIAKDGASLEKLYAPDLTYTHSSGKTETKAEAIAAVVNGKGKIEKIELADTTVRIYGKTALVKGKVTLTAATDSKQTTTALNILHVWVKNSSGWQLVARQAIRLTQ
jgi:ketosteroid isomerase-like protein